MEKHNQKTSLADPRTYGDPAFHDLFLHMRSESPVYWSKDLHGDGFWSLFRHDHIARFLRTRDVFSSEYGMMLGTAPGVDDPGSGRMLVATDPPRHSTLRRVMSRAISPREVRRLSLSIDTTASSLISENIGRQTDLVWAIAARLPCYVVCDILGVPRQDWSHIYDLTSRAFGAADRNVVGGEQSDAARTRAHSNLLMYYYDLIQIKRRKPADDLVSILCGSVVDGRRLDDDEIALNCDNFTVGGNETTRQAISGLLHHLATNPSVLSDIGRKIDFRAATEEVLRWTSPALHAMRRAMVPTKIGATEIEESARVVAWLPAANRDPAVFENPFQFKLDRSPNPHLVFGDGIHACMGDRLARLEVQAVLRAVRDQVQTIDLASPPNYIESIAVWGIRELRATLNGHSHQDQPQAASDNN